MPLLLFICSPLRSRSSASSLQCTGQFVSPSKHWGWRITESQSLREFAKFVKIYAGFALLNLLRLGGGRQIFQGPGHEIIDFIFKILQGLLRVLNLLRGTRRPNGLPRISIRHGGLEFGQCVGPHGGGNTVGTERTKNGVKRQSVERLGLRRSLGLGERARFIRDDEVRIIWSRTKPFACK